MLGISYAPVFLGRKGRLFLVVDKENDPGSLEDSNVFVVRPEEWLKRPEWRKRGDPYERFWARGPCDVELEHLIVEGKKVVKVIKAKPDDLVGDLRIEVPKELDEGYGKSDKMRESVRSLEVGDMIRIQGPVRRS